MKTLWKPALLLGALSLGLAGGAFASTGVSYGSGGLNATGSDGEQTFQLRMNHLIQTRFTGIASEESTTEDKSYFRLHRLRTFLSGHVFDEAFVYSARLDFEAQDMSNLLGIGYVGYRPSDSWGVFAGKHWLPFSAQRNTLPQAQQFTDRSATDDAFNMGYGQGVWAHGAPTIGDSGAQMRYWAGIYNGMYDGQTFRQNDTLGVNHANDKDGHKFLYGGRVEFMPFGGATTVGAGESDLRDEASRGDMLAMFGVGANYYQGTFQGEDVETWNLTADARVHFNGLSVNLAGFYRGVHFDNAIGGNPKNVSDTGFNLQVGYNHHLEGIGDAEIAARVGYMNHDDRYDVEVRNDSWEYALAANLRMYGDRVRFTGEAAYHVDDIPGIGNGKNQKWEFRLQAQFQF
jgi:hypothetical protein